MADLAEAKAKAVGDAGEDVVEPEEAAPWVVGRYRAWVGGIWR